ncbi:MAG: M16 family metallopeptidase [Fidelibacterota bacterium]
MFKKSMIFNIFITLLLNNCIINAITPFTIDYEKYLLDNGLTVILHEDKSDPIVGVAIQYHVGSNREIPGRTGFAHLFEHMLFQESQHVGQDQFFKKIQNVGGTLNGGTWEDGTVYYEIVPKNALETVLWMESDRMGWLLSTVTQSSFENQQEVVQNEKRQRVDNRPYGYNNYIIIKNLYPEGHPYNWTVIGELEDLQNATLKDVRDFYEKWYGPNNATMVIAGDINKRQVKKFVEKYFGEIKSGPVFEDPKPIPVQLNETKKLYYEDNFASSPRLTMVFPTVDQRHPDAAALELFGQLLGDGKKAPLYKVIVEEKKLAPTLYSYNGAQEIAGTFKIVVNAFPTSNLTEVESAIHESFSRFEIDGFTDEDLERLKAKYETGFYRGISSVLSKGFQLAQYNEYYGSPDAIAEELQKVLDVNMDDIKRVYKKYIKGQNYVMTSFVPKGKVDLAADGSVFFPVQEEKIVEKSAKETIVNSIDIENIPSLFDRSVEPVDGPQPRLHLPRIWHYAYKNGVSIYGTKHDELPLINFGIQIEGGILLDDQEKVGVANLISDLMMQGTANRTPIELEEAIDALGSSITMYTGKETIGVEVTTLKRNFEATLALVEEILFEPRWDETEFDRVKRETAEAIKRRASVPSAIASKVFNKLLYKNHILANETVGTVEALDLIKLDDLKNYYAKNFSADLATITIVGDISRSQALKAFRGLVNKWEIKKVTFPKYELPQPESDPKVYFVDVPNAKQSEIRIGYLGLARTDPDFFPATVMNMKLGGNFSGNVNLVLREEKGFTYGARTRFTGTKFLGKFTASSGVQSNTTEESINIFKELMTAYRDPISSEDLEFTKNVLLKSNARRFETLGALRGMIDNIATYNLPFDYINDQENIIRQMTIESHNELAQKWIRPDEMIYLVVGDAATQLEGMKSLGFGDPILLDPDGNPVE